MIARAVRREGSDGLKAGSDEVWVRRPAHCARMGVAGARM